MISTSNFCSANFNISKWWYFLKNYYFFNPPKCYYTRKLFGHFNKEYTFLVIPDSFEYLKDFRNFWKLNFLYKASFFGKKSINLKTSPEAIILIIYKRMTIKQFIPTYEPCANFKPNVKFTVFVPVFNSGHTVHRIFTSLNNQTLKDFEVILINDGSTDDSHYKITSLSKTAKFNLTYVNNIDNKHKMGCIMEAVSLAKGEFFITLDSDDECIPQALELFLNHYNEINEELKHNISGVTCCCMDQNGLFQGDYFPEQPFYSNTFENKFVHSIKGEKWGFTKTEILKGVKINNDLFSRGLIPEGYLWLLVSKLGYKTKYVNEVMRTYYRDTDTSLSSLKYDKKAFGMIVYAICFIEWFHKDYFYKIPKMFLMRLYSLINASNYLEYKVSDYLSVIKQPVLKVILLTVWPLRKLLK